ncbi:hypothetical protein [Streptomyces clavuligerus]|nr:hypothetical protein [Streptomyces clavuligerus]WDN56880.1 hypothetical protein LL058_34315 [Streptomyces clavuligerus]
MRRPLLLTTATAAVVVLLGTGCARTDADGGAAGASPAVGADGGTPSKSAAATEREDPVAVVRAAIAATTGTSADFTVRLDLDGGPGERFQIRADGSFDMARDRGRLEVEAVQSGNKGEEIFADGRIYMRNLAPAGVNRDWAVRSRDSARANYLLRAPLNDPEHTLRQVARMREVRSGDKQTLNGARVDHYGGILDHSALLMGMSKQGRKQLDELRTAFGHDLPVSAEIWIDDRGRAVRTRVSLVMPGAATVMSTLTLSDFGTPVRVTEPQPVGLLSDTPNILAG